MADHLGLTQQTVASWEQGTRKPSFEVLSQIASEYSVSIDYLLGNKNEKNEPDDSSDETLANVYFRFAKDAERNGIDPEDIQNAIELIKKLREPK